jgi:hypothetical protein
MAKRPWWFPGADQQFGGTALPKCDEPPTLASSLDAATNVIRDAKEERDAQQRGT